MKPEHLELMLKIKNEEIYELNKELGTIKGHLSEIKAILKDVNDNYYGKFDFYKSYIGRKINEIDKILGDESD